jgi:hypothetical protein
VNDYYLRVKASDRVPLRNALIALDVMEVVDGNLIVKGPGGYDVIGPLRNMDDTDWVKVGGEIAHHYNLRLPYDLRQRIIDLAAEGNTTAQTIIANRARFYARIGGGGIDEAPEFAKRVWL